MRTGPSVIERMGAYQRATGLKPIGVHRPAADKLLKGVSHRCVQCGGQGYVEVRRAWIWCEVCGGLGRVMTAKEPLIHSRKGATACEFSPRTRSEDRADVDPRQTSDEVRGENRSVP